MRRTEEAGNLIKLRKLQLDNWGIGELGNWVPGFNYGQTYDTGKANLTNSMCNLIMQTNEQFQVWNRQSEMLNRKCV